jgi:hypothetical protein
VKDIRFDLIRLDSGAQARAKLNEETVAQYAEAIEEGATFPPMVVFHDGADYWLAGGFHRYHAFRKVGVKTIEVDLIGGSRRDAVLFGVSDNKDHGLPRTNADKRKAVGILLTDSEWKVWSDREIGRRVGVAHAFVGRVKAELSLDSESSEKQPVTYTTKHGTVATMKPRQAAAPAQAEPETTVATPATAPAPGPVTVLTPTPSPELDPAPAPKLSPTPSPAPAGDVDWKAKYDELLEHSEGMAATLEAMSAEYDRMTAVVDADDKLKAALARIKQLEELVAAMERRNWGLMAEKNDVIRTAKHFKRMAERYRRQGRLSKQVVLQPTPPDLQLAWDDADHMPAPDLHRPADFFSEEWAPGADEAELPDWAVDRRVEIEPRRCRDCQHCGALGHCAETVAAGLFTEEHGHGIARGEDVDPNYAQTCKAFMPKANRPR